MSDAFIDLHTHSTISDGSVSPSDLVRLAVGKKLRAIALTDHDTVDGIDEALLEAEKHPDIEVIPGIEISAEYSEGTTHLLGYFIDYKDPLFIEKIDRLKKAREDRNPIIIKKLNDLGLEITEAEVNEIAGSGVVGRPHIAEALLKRGHVKTMQEAFDLYLGKNGKAYTDKERLSHQESIDLIHKVGGVVVLAHPKFVHGGRLDNVESLISTLAGLGLDGLEVYYASHSPKEMKWFKQLAEKYSLLITGGSDFHGEIKPDIEVGVGMGNLKVPYELVEKLKQRAEEIRVL